MVSSRSGRSAIRTVSVGIAGRSDGGEQSSSPIFADTDDAAIQYNILHGGVIRICKDYIILYGTDIFEVSRIHSGFASQQLILSRPRQSYSGSRQLGEPGRYNLQRTFKAHHYSGISCTLLASWMRCESLKS